MRTISLCIVLALSLCAFAGAQCSVTGDPAVSICASNPNQISPVRFTIATNDTAAAVDLLQVYIDQTKRWENHVSSADFFLATAPTGQHHVTAVAHDTHGRWFQSSIFITVNGATYTCTGEQIQGQAPHTMNICQPADGEIHYSPVHLAWWPLGASNTPAKVIDMYIDGVRQFHQPPSNGSQYNSLTDLPMAVGRRRITIQSYDSTGTFKKTIYMNVNKIQIGCAPPTSLPDVNFCGNSLSGAVYVKVSAASSWGILQMKAFIDNVQVATTNHPYFDQVVNEPAGTHELRIDVVDNGGNHFSRSQTVSVQ
jgi:hypothetical protein